MNLNYDNVLHLVGQTLDTDMQDDSDRGEPVLKGTKTWTQPRGGFVAPWEENFPQQGGGQSLTG